MSYQKLLPQMIGLTLVMSLLVGCGAPPATPVSEAPVATSTPVPPTATPVPPASVPGIDEPLTVADVEIQVLEAYAEDGTISAGGRTLCPDEPSDTCFEVVVAVEGTGNPLDWVAGHMRLAYEGEEYEPVGRGVKFGEDGKFAGTTFVFSVPKGSEFAGYTLQLTDEASIALASFFE